MTVFVVQDHRLFGTSVDRVYEDEADALRRATERRLPEGVLRRSVTPMPVIPPSARPS